MKSYVRTEAGNAAVANPRVFLPTRLRAMLASIDGRADPLKYGLGSLRPEEARLMLETLCKVGYVVQVGDTGGPAANDSRPAALPALQAAPVRAAQAPTAPPAPARAATLAIAASDAQVREVVGRMSDFIMTHLPAQSLDVLFALEGLTSAAQLHGALGAYAQHIAPLGAVAERHLAEIKAALAAPHATPTTNHP